MNGTYHTYKYNKYKYLYQEYIRVKYYGLGFNVHLMNEALLIDNHTNTHPHCVGHTYTQTHTHTRILYKDYM